MLGSSGCAWLFQEHLPSGYQGGKSEPDCSSSSGWGFADGVLAVASGIGALAYAADSTNEDQAVYVISNVATLVIHTASAFTGLGWSSDCRKAKADWDGGSADRDDEREIKRLEREMALQEEAEARRAPPPRKAAPKEEPQEERQPAPAARPRGFFCATSPMAPTTGLCTRIKSECTRTRSIALGAVADLTECTLIESAFCFDAGSGDEEERCAPTADACTTQLESTRAAASAPGRIGDCVEQW